MVGRGKRFVAAPRDPIIAGSGKVGGANGGGRGRTEGRDWGAWDGSSDGMGVVTGRLLASMVTGKVGGGGMAL